MTTRQSVAMGYEPCSVCRGWMRIEDSPGMDHPCPHCKRTPGLEPCAGCGRKAAHRGRYCVECRDRPPAA